MNIIKETNTSVEKEFISIENAKKYIPTFEFKNRIVLSVEKRTITVLEKTVTGLQKEVCYTLEYATPKKQKVKTIQFFYSYRG